MRFVYLLEPPRRGDSKNYTKRMSHKKLFKTIRYSCLGRVYLKFLYNSKFDLTAKSLVTNSVVITRIFCITNTLAWARALRSIQTCVENRQKVPVRHIKHIRC